MVDDALSGGLLAAEELVGQTDEGILHVIAERARAVAERYSWAAMAEAYLELFERIARPEPEGVEA